VIQSLLTHKKPYLWAIFHVSLGFLSIASRWPLILWFIYVMAVAFGKLLQGKSNRGLTEYIALCSYLISLELLYRLAKTSPFIPYEASKYLLPLFFISGVILTRAKAYGIGILMAMMVLPAFFYDFSHQSGISGLIFNGLAALGLGFGVAFLGKVRIEAQAQDTIIRLLWYGTVSALMFVIFKTPDFDSIEFNLGANFDTTGGESSNQVASVLGLGMALSFYSWLSKLKFSGNRTLDLLFTIAFGFQGLLTFSRGGIFVGGLAIIILYFTSSQASLRSKKQRKIGNPVYYMILFAVAGFFTFRAVDKITGGKLTLRYQGETEGTLVGSKEKDINVLTTNRFVIFIGDLGLWSDHPITGVGVGASKYLREGDSSNPHIELSRLLAEHGIPGLIYFILLVYLGFRIYGNRGSPQHRSVMLTLYFIGFATCFHSATRTFITPLLVSLSTMLPAQSGTKK
jgi:hypothetical protein